MVQNPDRYPESVRSSSKGISSHDNVVDDVVFSAKGGVKAVANSWVKRALSTSRQAKKSISGGTVVLWV